MFAVRKLYTHRDTITDLILMAGFLLLAAGFLLTGYPAAHPLGVAGLITGLSAGAVLTAIELVADLAYRYSSRKAATR